MKKLASIFIISAMLIPAMLTTGCNGSPIDEADGSTDTSPYDKTTTLTATSDEESTQPDEADTTDDHIIDLPFVPLE